MAILSPIMAVNALEPDQVTVDRNASAALREDIGTGDLCAPLLADAKNCSATALLREDAVLCGGPWFDSCFRQADPQQTTMVDWRFGEGDRVKAGNVVCVVSGPAAPMLAAERSAINFLQMLSGTATLARRFVEAIAETDVLVVDTRKTIPGLRHAQKYAVRTGGLASHRSGLYDGALAKENHIAAAGGLERLLCLAANRNVADLQVEVRSLDELRRALDSGARRILLDNFNPDAVGKAVAAARRTEGIELEVSGNITLSNIADYARTGVNRISVGALTKNVRSIDFSFRLEEMSGA